MKGLTTTLMTGVLALSPMLALADEPTSPHSVSGNLSFTSNYVFRGFSQTTDDPAIQGGMDYSHESGLYLGTWASNVSSDVYTGANMEWDVYAGYSGAVTDDFSYDVGLLQYYYPGGDEFNTTEAYAGATFNFLNVKYSHSLTDLFGVDDSKGSGYLEGNANFDLPQSFSLGLHVGHQKVKNSSDSDYTDYKVSLSKELGGFDFSLAYTDTDYNSDASDEKFFVSVGKAF